VPQGLAILVVFTLGLMGMCQRAGRSSQERIKILEAKVSRLEGDLKVGESAREQLRKKLTAAENGWPSCNTIGTILEKTLTARNFGTR